MIYFSCREVGGVKHLDESNLVGDIEGIDISGKLDVGLLVTIGAK